MLKNAVRRRHSFEDFDQFSTTIALAELQLTTSLYLDLFGSFQSAEAYLSEMSQNFSNTGDIRLSMCRINDYSGASLSDIEEILQNVNSYGLSHLCAFSILELAGEAFAGVSYEYLLNLSIDIYLRIDRANSKHDVKFYSSGFKKNKTTFKN